MTTSVKTRIRRHLLVALPVLSGLASWMLTGNGFDYMRGFQELAKIFVAMAAIVSAFVPSFYVYINANAQIRSIIKRLGVDSFHNLYFRRALVSSALLLVLAICTLFTSYSPTIAGVWTHILFTLSTAALALTGWYTYLFGSLSYRIVTSPWEEVHARLTNAGRRIDEPISPASSSSGSRARP